MLNAEYYKTDSIITKIYLYLILWENIWQEITEIESDIEQYSNESILFFGGGCVGYNENVGLIIEAIKDDISFLRLPEEEKQKYWDKLERQMSDNPDVFEIYPARKNSLFR